MSNNSRLAAATAVFVGAFAIAACRQDMHDQAKYEPLEASDFYPDRSAARPLVPGTVPRGHLDEPDRASPGAWEGVQTFPFPVTADVMKRGQERFNIFCAPCHSRNGDGDGMIVRRGYRRPPSFHVARLRESTHGHLFDVITNGFGAMPDYREQIAARDRWAIVAYVRALQLSQRATVADVPDTERGRLSARPDSAPSAGASSAKPAAKPTQEHR